MKKLIVDLVKAILNYFRPTVPNTILITHEVELTAMSMMEVKGAEAWESYVRGRLMQGFIEKVEPYIVYSRRPLPGGSESFKLTLLIIDRNKVKI